MMVSKKLENALSSRLVHMSPLQQSLAGSHLMLPLLCHQVLSDFCLCNSLTPSLTDIILFCVYVC